MLLQLRKHDGSTEEIEVINASFAREIAVGFEWDAERRRFENQCEAGMEAFYPSIAFMDNSGRVLEFGPNSDATFWMVYRYSVLKSEYGFFPIDQNSERYLNACELGIALDVMTQHYAGEHMEIIARLVDSPDNDQDEGEVREEPPVVPRFRR